MDLSIIIPCLNEEENLPIIFKDLNSVLKSVNFSFEIIILDDRSRDKTLNVAHSIIVKFPKLNIKVIHRGHPRRGYGAVVRYGMAYAVGKYCIFVSADCVDPISLIPKFFQMMENGSDLVQCSRYLREGDDSTIPFKYKFYQSIYRFLIRIIIGESIADSTYSFKMFNRNEILGLGVTQNRFSISPEIIFKTLLSGGKIEFVAAGQGIRRIGKSHFNFLKEGYGYAYVLFRALLHKIGIWWF